jgi:hypothetical protein
MPWNCRNCSRHYKKTEAILALFFAVYKKRIECQNGMNYFTILFFTDTSAAIIIQKKDPEQQQQQQPSNWHVCYVFVYNSNCHFAAFFVHHGTLPNVFAAPILDFEIVVILVMTYHGNWRQNIAAAASWKSSTINCGTFSELSVKLVCLSYT